MTTAKISEALHRIQAGDWDAAHQIVQDLESRDACWIHAYLHRMEGDEGNAAYWYRRANRRFPSISLDEEREVLIGQLMSWLGADDFFTFIPNLNTLVATASSYNQLFGSDKGISFDSVERTDNNSVRQLK